MIVRTRIFELCSGSYKNLSQLAMAMDLSVSQVYRVREGKRPINQKFIIGAMKAFPDSKLDDLFYVTTQMPDRASASLKRRNGDSPLTEETLVSVT